MSKPTFPEWLGQLAAVFVKDWDYTPENARAYVLGQPEAWRDFYDDDFSPADAAHEDACAGY